MQHYAQQRGYRILNALLKAKENFQDNNEESDHT